MAGVVRREGEEYIFSFNLYAQLIILNLKKKIILNKQELYN